MVSLTNRKYQNVMLKSAVDGEVRPPCDVISCTFSSLILRYLLKLKSLIVKYCSLHKYCLASQHLYKCSMMVVDESCEFGRIQAAPKRWSIVSRIFPILILSNFFLCHQGVVYTGIGKLRPLSCEWIIA